jgi:hypothetical protein
MPAVEHRLARDVFTRKLNRICKRLDGSSQRTIECRDFFRRKTSAEVRIVNVWAVGSYARGALKCGDLDIVLEIEVLQGGRPWPHEVARAFFGTLPYVRYYDGIPATNTSGVAFPEAVPIWTKPQCDWQAAIAAIPLDPSAGRAARATDDVPFNLEQLYCEADELEEIIDLRNRRFLEWEFVALDPLQCKSVEIPRQTDRDSVYWHAHSMGKKSQQLLPAFDQLMKIHEPFGAWIYSHPHGRQSMKCGGTLIRYGRPEVRIDLLTENVSIRQLVIVPHFTRRGPNGAWFIRRGLQHPDVKALADKYAYYHVTEGLPDIITDCPSENRWECATFIDLFDSEEKAQAQADELNNDSDFMLEVRCVEGAEILTLTGLCDALFLNGEFLPLTYEGKRLAERETQATVAELAAWLPDRFPSHRPCEPISA